MRRETRKYKHQLFRTNCETVTRSGATIKKGQLLLALEEPIQGWVPVIYGGTGEYVCAGLLTSEKKLTALKNKRSKATKRGWATRRKNERARKLRDGEACGEA
jgi:hypothetical protein